MSMGYLILDDVKIKIGACKFKSASIKWLVTCKVYFMLVKSIALLMLVQEKKKNKSSWICPTDYGFIIS